MLKNLLKTPREALLLALDALDAATEPARDDATPERDALVASTTRALLRIVQPAWDLPHATRVYGLAAATEALRAATECSGDPQARESLLWASWRHALDARRALKGATAPEYARMDTRFLRSIGGAL